MEQDIDGMAVGGRMNTLELYYLTIAFQRKELEFGDWLAGAIQWANDILEQDDKEGKAA